MDDLSHIEITPAPGGDASNRVYEFGCRLDKVCEAQVWGQIRLARALYNDLVASIRKIVDESRACIMANASDRARTIEADITRLNEAFAAHKAADDEPGMKAIAQERREKWHELAGELKEVRKSMRAELQSRFLSRIGKNASCDTYQLRSQAVANGLGWATANAVLDAALIAFKTSLPKGGMPRFAAGADKDQDTLTLQFTTAGGLPVEKLLSGGHGELFLQPPAKGAGRRSYGEFRFRLGAAKDDTYAHGTWQYHRAIPEKSSVAGARLVRRRIGKDYRYAIQLLVKQPLSAAESQPARLPLATIHFGWAEDIDGRRVAGIADCADPGAATILRLPPTIEEMLTRSREIQQARDTARDELVPRIKAEISLPDSAEEAFVEQWMAFRRTQTQHVSSNSVHRLCARLRETGVELPEWLERWRKADKLQFQSQAHIARRARNARKTFYRTVAADLASRYATIAIEPLDLKAAAIKVDKITGEKTDLARKARAGRVTAAIYELESALRWAATKHGCAVLDIQGKTATYCSICGGKVANDDASSQLLHCDGCGAELDRKQNGAALCWIACNDRYEDVVTDFWTQTAEAQREKTAKNAEKKERMMSGRAAARARTQSVAENA